MLTLTFPAVYGALMQEKAEHSQVGALGNTLYNGYVYNAL